MAVSRVELKDVQGKNLSIDQVSFDKLLKGLSDDYLKGSLGLDDRSLLISSLNAEIEARGGVSCSVDSSDLVEVFIKCLNI